jgi:DNA polymerase-3 subunit delta
MVTTLSGGNSLLLHERLNQLVAAFVEQYGDFGLERFDAAESEYAKLAESVQAMPFLADKRLVVIESPSANKNLTEKIDTFLDSVNDQTELILVEAKFDKRGVLYKTLKKRTEFQEFNELDENSLARWAVAYAKAEQGSVSSSDARYLVQRVGNDQLRMKNEIDKLVAYNPVITRDTINLLTDETRQSTVFNLLDAAFAGNMTQALQLYAEQRRQKVEPQAILAMIAWQLHVLALIKTAGDRSVDVIAKEAKLNPFVVRKSQAVAQRLSLSELKGLVRRTLTLDIRLKRQAIDADDALQQLLLSMAF